MKCTIWSRIRSTRDIEPAARRVRSLDARHAGRPAGGGAISGGRRQECRQSAHPWWPAPAARPASRSSWTWSPPSPARRWASKQLKDYLSDSDPAVRWWGAMGLGNDKHVATTALGSLQHALDDDSTAVRVAAARALDRAGHTDQALPILTAALRDENGSTRLWAITVLDEMDERARSGHRCDTEATEEQPNNYVQRVAQTALEDLNE